MPGGIIGIGFVTEYCYAPMSDRPTGILTKGDIEFLRGNSSKSDAAKRNQRMRIRNRVRSAIIDFSLLFAHLDRKDRHQVMLSSNGRSTTMMSHAGEELGPPELEWDIIEIDKEKPPIMTGGFRSMHAFSYQCLFEAIEGLDFFDSMDVHSAEIVESLVEESLQDAYGSIGAVRDVDVSITVSDPDVNLDQLESRFRSGKPLSDREVEHLIHCRRISFDEMVEFVRDESRHRSEESEESDSEYSNRGFQ